MISYRQFFDKLTSEQVQALAALQQKAIGLSADVAKFMDDTEDLLTEKEGQLCSTKTWKMLIPLPTQ